MSTADVDRADFILIGHSHFDHIAGAEVIGANTGAKIMGSNETARVMLEEGIPGDRLLRVQGGEHHRLNSDVTVRVYPSLHSCIWTTGSFRHGPEQMVIGDYGLTEDQRWLPGRRRDPPEGASDAAIEEMAEHRRNTIGSSETGGALAYVIETPEGSIFFQDTSGCWTSIVSDLRPDVAIVAMAGRPNIDGEPIQGSLAQYVGRMAGLMKPKKLFLGHHDDWMPPTTSDMTTEEALTPVFDEVGRVHPPTQVINVHYLEGTSLFD